MQHLQATAFEHKRCDASNSGACIGSTRREGGSACAHALTNVGPLSGDHKSREAVLTAGAARESILLAALKPTYGGQMKANWMFRFGCTVALFVLLDFGSAGVRGQQEKPKVPPPQAKPKSNLERLQEARALEEATAALDQLKMLVEKTGATKRFKCRAAFGRQQFCECIASKTPIGADFDMYIAVTTRSKDEIGYEKLGQEQRGVVDNTLNAREECVLSVFGKADQP
jgi:hypothetical protein